MLQTNRWIGFLILLIAAAQAPSQQPAGYTEIPRNRLRQPNNLTQRLRPQDPPAIQRPAIPIQSANEATPRTSVPTQYSPSQSSAQTPALSHPPTLSSQTRNRFKLPKSSTSERPTEYTDKWAIIVGIDRYEAGNSTFGDLDYAVNDARDFKELLVNEFGYQNDHVRYLIDLDASQAEVVDSFTRWLPGKQPKESDSVLVFFAGHGTREGQLACVDTRIENQSESNVLLVSQVRDWLAALRCKHKLVILDSCYSGALFKNLNESENQKDLASLNDQGQGKMSLTSSANRSEGNRSNDGTTGNPEKFAYYLQHSAFFGMSAGRNTPVADGSEQFRHSPFTGALLQVMRERADSPEPDHAFNFRQLAAMVEKNVKSGTGQVPNWGRLEQGEGDFVFRPEFRRKTPSEISAERLLESEWRLYAMQIASSIQAWDTGNVAKAWSHFNECRWDFRGWEHDYLYGLLNQNQTTLEGHVGLIYSVMFSPDGSRFVSVSEDGTIRIWDANNGRRLMVLNAKNSVCDVDWSSDGRWIVSGGQNGAIQIWDATSGEIVSTTESEQVGIEICVRPDDTMIASGSWEDELAIWDVETGQKIESYKGDVKHITCLTFSPDGKQLVYGGTNGDIRVLDVGGQQIDYLLSPDIGAPVVLEPAAGQSEVVKTFAKTGAVFSLRFSPDGKQLLSSSNAGLVEIWSFPSAEKILKIDAENIQDVDFSADGSQIVGGDTFGQVHVWDASDGKKLLTFKGHSSEAGCVAASPTGRKIVSGDSSGVVKLWDSGSPQISPPIKAHDGVVFGLAISPDGRRLVTSGKTDRKLVVWDAQTGVPTSTISTENIVNQVAFSPDGRQFVTGGGSYQEPELWVWDTTTGQRLQELEGHADEIKAVAFSADGRKVVSGDDERVVKVWDVASGKATLSITLPEPKTEFSVVDGVTDVDFSPDGKNIIATDLRTIRSWDSSTGQEGITFAGHRDQVRSVAFGPDGRTLASGSNDGTVRIWDTRTGQELMTLFGHNKRIDSVSFSPDGRRILSGGNDDNIKLWDTATGQETLALQFDVARATFSPDGRKIVAASWDGDVKTWKILPARSALTLNGRGATIVCARFSPDGKQIVSGSHDGSVTVWSAVSGIELLDLDGHENDVRGVNFTPDSKQIVGFSAAAITGSEPGEIKFWDARSGQVIRNANLNKDANLDAFALSPDGEKIVGGKFDITVWDTSKMTKVFESDTELIVDVVSFSRNGNRIAVGGHGFGSGGTIEIWDLVNKSKAFAVGTRFSITTSVCFSPDDQLIAYSGHNHFDEYRERDDIADEMFFVIDAVTGDVRHTFQGHVDHVNSIDFSPDGTKIVSGSQDGTVKIWDVATAEELMTFYHSRSVKSVEFSPDGTRVVSSGGDLKVWRVAEHLPN